MCCFWQRESPLCLATSAHSLSLEEHIMKLPKLYRALAATAAASITLGIFSAVTSIAAEDRARLAYAHTQVFVAANAPDAVTR